MSGSRGRKVTKSKPGESSSNQPYYNQNATMSDSRRDGDNWNFLPLSQNINLHQEGPSQNLNQTPQNGPSSNGQSGSRYIPNACDQSSSQPVPGKTKQNVQGSRSKVAAGKTTTTTYLPQDPVDKSNKKLLENLNQALNKLPWCGQSGSRDVASSITNFGANNESTQNPLEGLGFIQTSSEKLESVSKAKDLRNSSKSSSQHENRPSTVHTVENVREFILLLDNSQREQFFERLRFFLSETMFNHHKQESQSARARQLSSNEREFDTLHSATSRPAEAPTPGAIFVSQALPDRPPPPVSATRMTSQGSCSVPLSSYDISYPVMVNSKQLSLQPLLLEESNRASTSNFSSISTKDAAKQKSSVETTRSHRQNQQKGKKAQNELPLNFLLTDLKNEAQRGKDRLSFIDHSIEKLRLERKGISDIVDRKLLQFLVLVSAMSNDSFAISASCSSDSAATTTETFAAMESTDEDLDKKLSKASTEETSESNRVSTSSLSSISTKDSAKQKSSVETTRSYRQNQQKGKKARDELPLNFLLTDLKNEAQRGKDRLSFIDHSIEKLRLERKGISDIVDRKLLQIHVLQSAMSNNSFADSASSDSASTTTETSAEMESTDEDLDEKLSKATTGRQETSAVQPPPASMNQLEENGVQAALGDMEVVPSHPDLNVSVATKRKRKSNNESKQHKKKGLQTSSRNTFEK